MVLYNTTTLIERSNGSIAFLSSRQYSRLINKIRPNRLDRIRENVISGINIKIDITLSLYFVLNFLDN